MAISTVLAVICCVAGIIAMNHDRESWLERLEMLLTRFSHLGIGADVASLSLIELWTLYVYLSRLMEG